ncbi:hypothetical protein GE115_07445 [Agromyces sp. CFH 90414]|uniref:DUF998 domain-containing protein n=1 Tax=Agromyces agglutinans TaxID=2662258 RepID=A0A6I2FCQ4_9MICO|nr:hypothetical protein [Agromyces agglutinans]MRG59703.1 hypothetical protein [Agromyces agglutinans]
MSTATLTQPPRTASSVVRTVGILTIVGAVIGIVGGTVLAFVPPGPGAVEGTFAYPLDPAGHALAEASFILNHLLLGAGLLVATLSPEAGTRPGRLGGWIALAGMAALTVAEAWAIPLAGAAYPSDETAGIDVLYGVSSMLLGVGLVLLGIGIARAPRSPGAPRWHRWIVLVLGIMVFAVVTPGLMLGFTGGRLALVAWQVAWAAFGVAIVQAANRAGRR